MNSTPKNLLIDVPKIIRIFDFYLRSKLYNCKLIAGTQSTGVYVEFFCLNVDFRIVGLSVLNSVDQGLFVLDEVVHFRTR